MPQTKNLTVQVTDRDGNTLDEWGVQNLRGQNKISAYIKSCNDMAFQVTVKPNIPFPDTEATTCNGGIETESGPRISKDSHPNVKHHESRYAQSLNEPSASNQASKPHDIGPEDKYLGKNKLPNSSNWGRATSSPSIAIDSKFQSQSPPPFHLLASLYLDGRQNPERRNIIYLDPEHEDFTLPDGKVKFKRRCEKAKDGTMREVSWAFREVGIEKKFGKMSIEGAHNEAGHSSDQNEDTIVALMSSAGLGAEGDFQHEQSSSAGQIQLVFQRVVLGAKWQHSNYQPVHREDEMEDTNLRGARNDITHTAGFEYAWTLPPRPTGIINFWPYVPDEAPYATFYFFYRNQEVLERFNFPGFPRSSRPITTTRHRLNKDLSNLTPLSISHPIEPSKRKAITSEQQVQEKPFGPDLDPKLKLHDKYREAVAFNEEKSASRRQALLSSDRNIFLAAEKPTSFALSRRIIDIEPSQQCDKKAIPHKGIFSISDTSATISMVGRSFSVIQSESVSTPMSRAIRTKTKSMPNHFPKTNRKRSQEGDVDGEGDSKKEVRSGDDGNALLSQEDVNFLIWDFDDFGLRTELDQVAAGGTRGSPIAESFAIISEDEISEDEELEKKFTRFADNVTETLSFNEQGSPNTATQVSITKSSKRFKQDST